MNFGRFPPAIDGGFVLVILDGVWNNWATSELLVISFRFRT